MTLSLIQKITQRMRYATAPYAFYPIFILMRGIKMTQINSTQQLTKHFIPLLLTFIPFQSLQAQDSHPDYRVGFFYGQGSQKLLSVNYHHNIKYFQMQISSPITVNQNWQADWIIIPQYNSTKFKYNHNGKEHSGYEFGVGFGGLIKANKWKNFKPYAGFAIGPHYVSGTPSRQSKGFIFSDNIFIGSTFNLTSDIDFDLRLGFRHISNASIKKPNGGINDANLSIGFSIKY